MRNYKIKISLKQGTKTFLYYFILNGKLRKIPYNQRVRCIDTFTVFRFPVIHSLFTQ
jgi:hypothetical protein